MVDGRAERVLGQLRLVGAGDAIEAGVLLELGTEEVLRCWTGGSHRNNGEQTGDRQHVESGVGRWQSVFFGWRKENVLHPLQAPAFNRRAQRIFAHDYANRYLIGAFTNI